MRNEKEIIIKKALVKYYCMHYYYLLSVIFVELLCYGVIMGFELLQIERGRRDGKKKRRKKIPRRNT
jgi:hypothetical protein